MRSVDRPVPLARLAGTAFGAVGFWIAVRLLAGFPPGVWPAAGNVYVSERAPSELVRSSDAGYDGQFVYRLAIEPFTTQVTGHGITLYQPGYRQQRIMTALLAHLVADLPAVSVAVAIIVVNAIAMGLALMAGVRLAESLGRDWRYGLVLAIPACLPISFAFDLTEPVEWAALLCGILAVRRGRWPWAATAFTVAVLARETAALVIAGFVVESAVLLCMRSRRRQADRERGRWWLLLPVVVEIAWQARLWVVWGSLPALTGFANTAAATSTPSGTDLVRSAGATHKIPLVGIARTFLNGLVTGQTTHPGLGVTYVIERIVLLALIGTAAWLLITRRARVGTALTVAWTLSTAVALLLSGWVDDIQFLRAAMEAWGSSVVVLLHCRTRWTRLVVPAAAAVVVWEVLFSLIRS